MPDSRGEKMLSLYDQALQLSSEERKQFLANACGRDDEFQREIESILQELCSSLSFSGHHLSVLARCFQITERSRSMPVPFVSKP